MPSLEKEHAEQLRGANSEALKAVHPKGTKTEEQLSFIEYLKSLLVPLNEAVTPEIHN